MPKRMLTFAMLIMLASAVLAMSLTPALATAAPLLAFTETFTPTATDTPVGPTNTPIGPTNTPIGPTGTPIGPTATSIGSTPTPADTVTPAPIIGDPLITKAVDLTQAQPGDLVQFTIIVTNPNTISVPNIVVVDELSNLLDFISATTGQGTFVYDPATRTLTFDIGTLAGGQVVIITIQTRVSADAQAPDQIYNAALLLGGGNPLSQSPVTTTLITPASLPGAGQGLGPRELALLLAAGLSALAVAGLGGLAMRPLLRGRRIR